MATPVHDAGLPPQSWSTKGPDLSRKTYDQMTQEEIENSPFDPLGTAGSAKPWTIHRRIEVAKLPNNNPESQVWFDPGEKHRPDNPLQRGNNKGYIDKYGNEWTKGPSRTKEEPFEWDVILSKRGKEKFGHLSRDGKHLNVSLKGVITH